MGQPLCVCYFGTFRSEYSRNQIMIEGLRRNQVIVLECHEKLWYGIEDRVQAASGGWLKPKFWLRIITAYTRLLRRYLNVGDYDVLIVGYPGQLDVFLARLLSWLHCKPLVWDVFMSIYLISVERGLNQHSRLTLSLIRKIESKALKLPDRLIQDTAEYIAWFEKTYGLSKECFRLVPTGADDRIFRPLPPIKCDDGIFRVIYYGTFIANHGVEYIIEAAHCLAHEENIHFELIGNGPEKEKASELAEKYDLRNLTFIDWLDQSELVKRVAQADLCLGAFGNTPQSVMTVQNKIFEGLAMAKPVITGDSPAVRKFLEHRVHVYLCERANGKSLANAIQTMRDDLALRDKIARNGHIIFTKRYDLSHIGQRYASHLESLISDFR